MQHKQKVKFKNPVLNWIEFRLPIVSYFKKEYGDYPMPKNCNYFWSFGAIAEATNIIDSIKTDFETGVAQDLEKRFINSIRSGDANKFIRAIKKLKDAKDQMPTSVAE